MRRKSADRGGMGGATCGGGAGAEGGQGEAADGGGGPMGSVAAVINLDARFEAAVSMARAAH